MNVLSKLSLKNLKMNKKRTISTIVGIILSISLICGVTTIASSFRETLIQHAINNSGNWHIKLENVNKENEKILEKNIDIKDIYKVNNIGYSKLDGIKNVDKPYVNVFSMDKDSFTNFSSSLLYGFDGYRLKLSFGFLEPILSLIVSPIFNLTPPLYSR